ncbi:hypothetical protein ACYOEI_00395 [Singulisphaera rosea]
MNGKRDWINLDEHLPESARTPANGKLSDDDEGTAESQFDGVTAMGIIGQGKPLVRLHIIREPGKRITMQYSSLDAYSEYEPGRFLLRFVSAFGYWAVEVKGRDLWKVYDACTRHAARMIQQVMPGRDFPDRVPKGEPVITEIAVYQVDETGKRL